MERFDWKKTIRPNIIMLKSIGLWPKEDQPYGFNFYTAYAIFAIIFCQTSHIISQAVHLTTILDNLELVTDCIYVSIMIIAVTLKSCCLMINMKKLKLLMITIDSDLFQPKNAKQRELVQSNLKAWQIIAVTYWSLAALYSIFMALFPILDKTSNEYRLPFTIWYPYDYKQSPAYELTYLYQIVTMNFISMANVNINPLMNALNMYIGAQFEILLDDLRNINNNDKVIDANQKLRMCIHHHKEILKFTDSVNEFYNWLLFVEIFVDGFSIGISMFQLTVVIPFSNEFYSFFSYLSAIMTQIFMYCWFGNEIEVKSSKLAYAVFESDWTAFSPEVKQDLIIFIERVKRPLIISAFGLFDLSLENFVKVVKTAWSYFALLRQLSS